MDTPKINYVALAVERLGGVKAAAEEVVISQSAIRYWIKKGYVPKAYDAFRLERNSGIAAVNFCPPWMTGAKRERFIDREKRYW